MFSLTCAKSIPTPNSLPPLPNSPNFQINADGSFGMLVGAENFVGTVHFGDETRVEIGDDHQRVGWEWMGK